MDRGTSQAAVMSDQPDYDLEATLVYPVLPCRISTFFNKRPHTPGAFFRKVRFLRSAFLSLNVPCRPFFRKLHTSKFS